MNEQASRLLKIRQIEERSKQSFNSKIISVCSGKGGTGKTFFSINFAYQLARLNKKVLLIDLDFDFPNLHLLLNLASEKPLSDFFLQRSELSELIVRGSAKLHFIFNSPGSSEIPPISRDMMEYFFIHLHKISDSYDYIILDSAAGADERTLAQLSLSTQNIIISSPEPTAVMDAYVIMKMITENSENSRNFVIINKSDSKEDGEAAYQNLNTAVRHFLSSEIIMLGIIGFDRAVYKSIIEQEVLLESYPNSVAALEISELTHRFLKITQVANNNQPISASF